MKAYKAAPLRGAHGRLLDEELLFCLDLPGFDDLVSWPEFADKEADRIERLLWRNMPGGVYDRLLGAMCKRKASLLRVAYGQEDT